MSTTTETTTIAAVELKAGDVIVNALSHRKFEEKTVATAQRTTILGKRMVAVTFTDGTDRTYPFPATITVAN